jgi:hypothetical protein
MKDNLDDRIDALKKHKADEPSLFDADPSHFVDMRTWTSDGIQDTYNFGLDQQVQLVEALRIGSKPFSIDGERLEFELEDNRLKLIDIPPLGVYFTAWYSYTYDD